jgi:hypothetical protein
MSSSGTFKTDGEAAETLHARVREMLQKLSFLESQMENYARRDMRQFPPDFKPDDLLNLNFSDPEDSTSH